MKVHHMNESRKYRIMVVDDAAENIATLVELLKNEYKIVTARSGIKALEKAGKAKPDLILLDVMMPEMNGYEVCRRLKQNLETRDIPVIFITSLGDTSDETMGFKLGAVDYIKKPISPPVLQARLSTHLKLLDAMKELKHLYSLALDANPITNLPGNPSIEKRIKQAIDRKERACVIYSDLDNFKAFNDKYGFALGDDVIRFTCKTLKEAVGAVGCQDAFVGHIGGDDFVLVVGSDKARATADEIASRFDDGIAKFYSPEDVAANCIQSVNRSGVPQVFPLMSISLAGVDLSHGEYARYVEVNDACSGAKKKAKAMQGSQFFMNRRKPSIT